MSTANGNATYGYDLAGLLTSRTVGSRQTLINSRDGEGRPLSIGTTVNLASAVTESLAYTGDGLISAHTLARSDFTDVRSYAYAALSRRVASEQLSIVSVTPITT